MIIKLPNRFKLAGLLLVYAGSMFALDKLGVHNLADPLGWLALAPLIAIYIAERLGLIYLFKGMSLPALLVGISTTLFEGVLNTQSRPPMWIGYLSLGLLLGALAFALLRLWTYREGRLPSLPNQ